MIRNAKSGSGESRLGCFYSGDACRGFAGMCKASHTASPQGAAAVRVCLGHKRTGYTCKCRALKGRASHTALGNESRSEAKQVMKRSGESMTGMASHIASGDGRESEAGNGRSGAGDEGNEDAGHVEVRTHHLPVKRQEAFGERRIAVDRNGGPWCCMLRTGTERKHHAKPFGAGEAFRSRQDSSGDARKCDAGRGINTPRKTGRSFGKRPQWRGQEATGQERKYHSLEIQGEAL